MPDWMKTAAEVQAEAAARQKAAITTAIDAHVEDAARSRDYNSAAALAGYAASTVSEWATEAQTFVAWRDAVWQSAFAMLAEVEAGTCAVPSAAEAVAELPAITWPE